MVGRGTQQCSFHINLDSARSLGAEATFKLKPIFGIGFDVAYTFVDSKQLSGENIGKPIQGQPRHLIVAKLSYNYKNFGTYLKLTSRLQTTTELLTNAATRRVLGDHYKDSHLLDLNVNYKFSPNLLLNFAVNNLLNQKLEYLPYTSTNNGTTTTGYVNAYQNWFDGRSYWVSLRYDI